MENKWSIKRERKARLAAVLKSLRIPLLTAAGIFVVAFFVIPFAFNGMDAPAALALEVGDTAAVAPTPLPTPLAPGVDPLVEETPALVQEVEPEGGDAQMPVPALQFGGTDKQVALIQQQLMHLWYMESDEPTEYFGPATEAAIRRFQRSHFMKETGVADAQTQAVLFSESAKPYVLEKGYSGEDVRALQLRLEELGYYADKSNGYFGTATTRAVSAFQTKNRLGASGAVDFDTKDLIFSPAARPAVDPTPTPTPTPTKTPRVTPPASSSPTPTKTPAASSSPKPSASATVKPSATPDGGWEAPIDTPAQTASPTFTQTPVIADGDVDDFIAVAKEQLGKPYVYGAKGPDSFDCSGLVYYCLRSVGVKVSRYSASGFSQMDSWTTVYGKDNLRRGDLLFYKSDGSSSTYVTHVAIWLGSGQILHASTSAGQICYTTWGSWSENNFLFAKRVF